MNNLARVGLALAALLIVPSGALAASTSAKTTPEPKVVMICPVTGDKVASIKDSAGHSTYQGVTYYFCCPGCKPQFDKNPSKYVDALKAKEHWK